MKIAYTRTAIDDLNGIADYLIPRNPAAAAKVEADVRGAVDRLAEYPLSGRLQDEANVRKAVSPGYRYRILYVADLAADVVTVLSILHPSKP